MCSDFGYSAVKEIPHQRPSSWPRSSTAGPTSTQQEVSVEHSVVMQVRCQVQAAQHRLSSLVHPAHGICGLGGACTGGQCFNIYMHESTPCRSHSSHQEECPICNHVTAHQRFEAAYLKVQTPALWMSKALKDTGGRLSATHSRALKMDLWVTTRCCVPSASRMSAQAMKSIKSYHRLSMHSCPACIVQKQMSLCHHGIGQGAGYPWYLSRASDAVMIHHAG